MSKKLLPKQVLYKGIVGFVYEEPSKDGFGILNKPSKLSKEDRKYIKASGVLKKVRKPMAKPTKIIKSKKQKRLEKIRRKEENERS